MVPLPRIRQGLLSHQLDGQVLVYDSRDDRIHLLDPTTGCVLELLQEHGWTAAGVTTEVARRLGIVADPALLALALEELRKADLLDESAPVPAPMVDVNRRTLLRKLAMTGAAAALVPAIASLTATTGYAQGSLLGLGATCVTNAQCASARCCGGTCQTAGCEPDHGVCSVVPPNRTTVADCACCSGFCDNKDGNIECTKP